MLLVHHTDLSIACAHQRLYKPTIVYQVVRTCTYVRWIILFRVPVQFISGYKCEVKIIYEK